MHTKENNKSIKIFLHRWWKISIIINLRTSEPWSTYVCEVSLTTNFFFHKLVYNHKRVITRGNQIRANRRRLPVPNFQSCIYIQLPFFCIYLILTNLCSSFTAYTYLRFSSFYFASCLITDTLLPNIVAYRILQIEQNPKIFNDATIKTKTSISSLIDEYDFHWRWNDTINTCTWHLTHSTCKSYNFSLIYYFSNSMFSNTKLSGLEDRSAVMRKICTYLCFTSKIIFFTC
jgi:hypothetical protein